MTNRTKKIAVTVFSVLLVVLLGASIALSVLYPVEKTEDIKEAMLDAVMHNENKVSFLGLSVDPAVISAFVVTGIVLIVCLLIRFLVIPKFKIIPGKFQTALEKLVDLFDGIAKANSPHKNYFLGGYIFAAGCYIFLSTLFELLGLQAVTTRGTSVSLPAPLADINGAIAMAVMSYCVILSGGISGNGFRGLGNTLKDFSLPISMSFRLFGALLSGLLVTELVYFYRALSYVLPVFVGVMFTLLHAVIQTYVLITLTALFYGEVSEPSPKKLKKKNKNK